MDETKNIFLNMGDESVLVYCKTLSVDDVCKFAEAVLHEKPIEGYEVKQEELQYYCIDGRVWIDTPDKEKRALEIISKMGQL